MAGLMFNFFFDPACAAFLIFGFNLGILDLLFKIFLEIPFPLFLSLVPPERREEGMGTASGEGVLSGSFGCRWAFKDGGIKIPCGVEVDGCFQKIQNRRNALSKCSL